MSLVLRTQLIAAVKTFAVCFVGVEFSEHVQVSTPKSAVAVPTLRTFLLELTANRERVKAVVFTYGARPVAHAIGIGTT